MKALIDLITGFVDGVTSIINFIINTLTDLVYMVTLVRDMAGNIPSYFGWLPSAVVTSLVMIVGIVFVYKIIGREG